ncbi:MAG: hypothetical protein WCJ35_07825 [Planctomycetota bacterium]
MACCVASDSDSDSPDPSPRYSVAKCKAVYKKMMPSIKKHARGAFRYLRPEEKEECVQNVLANTWAALVGLARRGRLDRAFPSVLAKFAEKQTRDHRITGGHLAVKDVLSPYCQAKKHVRVTRLDRYDHVNECWNNPEESCSDLLAESRNTTPADLAASRIDFGTWLKLLPYRQRRIAKFLSVGNRTADTAKKFKVSAGRISQIRKELADNWSKFIGDEPGPAIAA